MKVVNPNQIINPKLNGYVIFCFSRLRDVALIELRNGFEDENYDGVLNFYIDRMRESIYSNNIDLKKFRRIKSLSTHYAKYKIFYSFSNEIEIKKELKSEFDYILISWTSNIIEEYYDLKRSFIIQNRSANFCKIKNISKLIENYKENYLVWESGELILER